MSPPAILQLGKIGDVINVLPIAHDAFVQTGHKPVFVISRQYASVLDRVNYVQPVIYEGRWDDLRGAIKWARDSFGSVISTQTYGDSFPIQKRTGSFALDAWDRAGMLSKWDKLPLVMPSGRAKQPLRLPESFVLLSDHSESSPCAVLKELEDAIATTLNDSTKLVRLSSIRVPNIADLVPIYNAAKALISIETSHLHLSRASTTPVLVLATDTPSRWHGSPWRQGYGFYCRYGEFKNRVAEFSKSLKHSLEGKPPIKSNLLDTPARAYNPAIIDNGEGLLTVCRHHPDATWRTELLANGKPIVVPQGVRPLSMEDARLFRFQDKLWMNYVVARSVKSPGPTGWQVRSIVGYGPLVESGGTWTLQSHTVPGIPGNDWSRLQKNFCPIVSDNRLYFIYSSEPHQAVMEVVGDKLKQAHYSKGPRWDWGEIRGGVVMPYGNDLLRFFHSRTGKANSARDFRYYIGALIMESHPPFHVKAVSKEPIIYGDEGVNLDNNPRFKANVVIPFGCVERDGKWLLSYGKNDCECRVAEITEGDLNL